MPSKNSNDDVCLLGSSGGRIHSLCWSDLVLASISDERTMPLQAVAAASTSINGDNYDNRTSSHNDKNNMSSRGNPGKAIGVYGLESGVDNPGPMPPMHPFATPASSSSGTAKTSATATNLEPLPDLGSNLFSDISLASAQLCPVQQPANDDEGGCHGTWSVKKNKANSTSSAASSQQRQQSFDPELVTDYIFPYLQDGQKPKVVSAGGDADVQSCGAIVGDKAGGWSTPLGAGRGFSPGTGGGRRPPSTSRRVGSETSRRTLRGNVGPVAVGAPQSPKLMTAATVGSTASRADIAPTVDSHGIKAPSIVSPASMSPAPATPVGGGEHARKHSFDTLAKMIPNLNELGNNKKAGWLKTPSPKTSQPAGRSYAATGAASPALPQDTSSLYPAQQSTRDSPTSTAQNMSVINTPSSNDLWGERGDMGESALPTHRQVNACFGSILFVGIFVHVDCQNRFTMIRHFL